MTKVSKARRVPAAHGIGGLLVGVSLAMASLAAQAAAPAAEAPAAHAALVQPAMATARASEAARTPARSERLLGSGESGPPAGALVLASLAVVALVAHRRLGH